MVPKCFDTLLISSAFEKKVLIDELAKFTYENFIAFRKEWLVSGNMLWFMAGNLQQEAAVKTLEVVRATLKLTGVPKEEFEETKCLNIPEGKVMSFEREV